MRKKYSAFTVYNLIPIYIFLQPRRKTYMWFVGLVSLAGLHVFPIRSQKTSLCSFEYTQLSDIFQ